MKNIYIVDEQVSSKTNGIGSFLKAYISCMKKMDVNITLISFNANVDEFDIKTENGIRILVFPVFQTDNFPAHYQIINRFIKLYIEDSVDNIFCFNHSPCRELLQTVKDSFPLSKLVFTVHDMGWTKVLNGDSVKLQSIIAYRNRKVVSNKYQYLLDYFDQEKQMYDIVDAVVCLSQSTNDILRNVYGIDESKIHLIPSGLGKIKTTVPVEEKRSIRKMLNIDNTEKIILYVGRLSEAKGVYSLVRAFSNILEIHPNTRLVLAGSANNEWRIFFSSVKYISSKITITGFIPKKNLKKWYQITDIGIIPSYYEQCPYVGLEMMMYGLPLVVSDASGLRDMFISGVNAEVAGIGNRKNEDEFSVNIQYAILKLLSSDELCRTMGVMSKQTFESTYSIRCMYQRYKCFFEKNLYNK